MISADMMSSPAYRATLLLIRWAQVNSALTFPFQSVSGLTEPIPNFAKFSGRKVGLRTEISDKSLRAHSAYVTIEHETKLK